MKKNKQEKLVPELRFKEFEGEWSRKTLGSMTTTITKGTTPTSIGYKYTKKGVKFVKVESLINSTINNEQVAYISKECHSALRRSQLRVNDVLFSIAGTLGRTAVVSEQDCPSNINQALAILRFEQSQNVNFLNLLLQRWEVKRWINSQLSVGAQPNLSLSQLSNFEILTTTLPEQQKISSFLSLVDKRIEQLNRKKELLELYKKGVMQKIFNRDIRFKDDNGNDYPEWEEKKLGEISSKKSSNISANIIDNTEGKYPVYGASGICGYIDTFQEKNPYISIIKDGAGVGRICFCDGETSVLGTLDIIKPKQNINSYYLFLLLNNIHFEKYKIGSTIPHIYYKDYKKESVLVPEESEQKKISKFIEEMDNNLEMIDLESNLIKIFKNGLLQQMFI